MILIRRIRSPGLFAGRNIVQAALSSHGQAAQHHSRGVGLEGVQHSRRHEQSERTGRISLDIGSSCCPQYAVHVGRIVVEDGLNGQHGFGSFVAGRERVAGRRGGTGGAVGCGWCFCRCCWQEMNESIRDTDFSLVVEPHFTSPELFVFSNARLCCIWSEL